jgi:probable F420-dependent oxidoreductase
MTSSAASAQATRERLGKVGVWLFGLQTPLDVLREQVARIDRLGYGSVWIGEGVGGKEAFAKSAVLLAETSRIVVGTGIANVNSRHGATMQAGGATLAEAYPDRFVLGIGIGHAFQAEHVGTQWRPLAQLREYLDQMDAEEATNPPPAPFPRIASSLGPKMLELTRDRTDGTHPFSSPVAHTAFAREVLGPDKLVIPHQTVLLEPDPARAREIARRSVGLVVKMPQSPYYRTCGGSATATTNSTKRPIASSTPSAPGATRPRSSNAYRNNSTPAPTTSWSARPARTPACPPPSTSSNASPPRCWHNARCLG